MESIPACYAAGRGTIPYGGDNFLFRALDLGPRGCGFEYPSSPGGGVGKVTLVVASPYQGVKLVPGQCGEGTE